MSAHLTAKMLSALADGELTAEELASAHAHLSDCAACTSAALYQYMLKTSTAQAGHRYAIPSGLEARIRGAVAEGEPRGAGALVFTAARRSAPRLPWMAWAVAAALLLAVGLMLMQRVPRLLEADQAGLFTEIFDQHVASLAATAPLQVLSTDRHTVKPWFQGKLPFSFNLPANLPADTTLDGANLVYLHDQPSAQLLFSIGKHRVSVFLRQRGAASSESAQEEHAGFRILTRNTPDLEICAISDADPTRLADLLNRIEQAQ
jgi:anti-sigma factor RsiW